MSEEMGFRIIKEEIGIICHEILLTQVVEDIRFEEELYGMERGGVEDICNHWVGGRRLPHAIQDGGSIIRTRAGGDCAYS